MKRLLLVGISLLITTSLSAKTYSDKSFGYSYSQELINQGYMAEKPPVYSNGSYDPNLMPAPAAPQAYGFYLQQPRSTPDPRDAQSSQMMWYPTQQQRAEASGSPVYLAGGYAGEQPNNVYNSPVYNSAVVQRQGHYLDAHFGIGATLGWKHGFDTPVGPVWGLAFGTRFKPLIRGDIEFNYHEEARLAKVKGHEVTYKQYDLGANVYYDFPVQSHITFKPFVGAGIWATKGKATAKHKEAKIVSTDSDIKLGLSVAGGVIYPLNELFSLYAMARARYIVTDENLYNLEGLLGIRYHF